MTETIFAVLNDTGLVVNTVVAEQSFINALVEAINDPDVDSGAYSTTDTFVNITNVSPRPSVGWYRKPTGQWVDGSPILTADRTSIPANGTTAATVKFTQQSSKAPEVVVFAVNGSEVTEPMSNGVATIQVTSTNPSDMVIVTVGDLSVTINVEA